MSARASRLLIARLRRNATGLIYAGGRLPDEGARLWVEAVPRQRGRPLEDGALRWQVVSERGWTNVGSRWPVLLVLNAHDLYFRRAADGDTCLVEVTP